MLSSERVLRTPASVWSVESADDCKVATIGEGGETEGRTEGRRRDTRGKVSKLWLTSAGRRFPEAKTVTSQGEYEQDAQETVWM